MFVMSIVNSFYEILQHNYIEIDIDKIDIDRDSNYREL